MKKFEYLPQGDRVMLTGLGRVGHVAQLHQSSITKSLTMAWLLGNSPQKTILDFQQDLWNYYFLKNMSVQLGAVIFSFVSFHRIFYLSFFASDCSFMRKDLFPECFSQRYSIHKCILCWGVQQEIIFPFVGYSKK